jgi:predicted amidophosphoribosyltransferase
MTMQANLRLIEGGWDLGYALDKHMIKSTFRGEDEKGNPQFDNDRTEIGEAVYQLKYNNRDFGQVPGLAQAIFEHTKGKFVDIGLVIPMPASTHRTRQPVHAVAEDLAKLLGVHSFDKMLSKTSNGKKLKDMNDRAEKDAALIGTIKLNPDIAGEGKWNALLIDDLFDTGASLDAACTVLRGYEKIGKIYVATLTWKKPK